jgi:hypothetical protein
MMPDLLSYIAIGVSVLAVLMSLLSAYLSVRVARHFERTVLQARNRELPATPDAAESTSKTAVESDEDDR